MKRFILLLLPLAMFAASDLVKEVRHELVTLPYYGVFDNLSYRVDGSKVTLFGQVRDPVLKDQAGKAVKSIEGVSAVDNQIEVLPASGMDDATRMAVYRAIYSKPTLQRYQLGAVPPIHIIVKNGNVTLEGVVANEMDKNVAGIAANGVSGVFKVTNNLRTDSGK
ncbi:MAG TPA: BON domain-containing protein [Bryobacteraceae bacterium]|nr:BON domain-containing protein [Bryobacteraceae bacterium]